MAWRVRAAHKSAQEDVITDYLIGEIEGMSTSDQVEELAETLGRLLEELPLSREAVAKILKIDSTRVVPKSQT
jgi:hypothetical protein